MSLPELFTVTEAAVVLRIGRTTAYDYGIYGNGIV